MEDDAVGAGYRNGKKDLARGGLPDSANLSDIAIRAGHARPARICTGHAVAEACALYADALYADALAMYATASRICIIDRPGRHGQSDTQRAQYSNCYFHLILPLSPAGDRQSGSPLEVESNPSSRPSALSAVTPNSGQTKAAAELPAKCQQQTRDGRIQLR
jgi:hypothetical protein